MYDRQTAPRRERERPAGCGKLPAGCSVRQATGQRTGHEGSEGGAPEYLTGGGISGEKNWRRWAGRLNHRALSLYAGGFVEWKEMHAIGNNEQTVSGLLQAFCHKNAMKERTGLATREQGRAGSAANKKSCPVVQPNRANNTKRGGGCRPDHAAGNGGFGGDGKIRIWVVG